MTVYWCLRTTSSVNERTFHPPHSLGLLSVESRGLGEMLSDSENPESSLHSHGKEVALVLGVARHRPPFVFSNKAP